jgi:hypothetical protein
MERVGKIIVLHGKDMMTTLKAFAGSPAGIRIAYLLNSSPQYYRCTNRLG